MQPSALRLFRFRPTSPSVDAKLRTLVVPDLLGRPGLQAIFAGRAEGTRLVASLWASSEAMDGARGMDGGIRGVSPELAEAMADGEVEVLTVAFSFPPERPGDVGILRLVRGTARAGSLDAYVTEAQGGTQADKAAGIGPQALYLAVDPPDRFVTLSLWDEWEHVEAATGADLISAERTRHAELLETWSAEHYEVIPGLAVARDSQTQGQPA